jgi:uncharacterized DUF497 family protein
VTCPQPPPGFEWDPKKRDLNLEKHGVDFFDATTVFEDRFARPLSAGIDAGTGEVRLRLMGHTKDHLLIVVAFVEREDDPGAEVIRIISAREALPHERKAYEENPWGPQ